MELGPFETGKVHCVDCLDAMKRLPDGCIQSCITSPPYWGLRDYGTPATVWGGDPDCNHKWSGETYRLEKHGDSSHNSPLEGDRNNQAATRLGEIAAAFCKCGAWRGSFGLEPTLDLYIEHIVEIFREVKRVLRKDGTLWLNLGDSFSCGKARSPEALEKGGMINENTQSVNRITRMPGGGRWGMGNNCVEQLEPKNLIGIPWRVAFALQADGWWLRSDIVYHKKNPMPESVKDRPTRSHEFIFLMTKSAKYYYDHMAIRELVKNMADNTHEDLERAFSRRRETNIEKRQDCFKYKSGNKERKYNVSAKEPHIGHSIPWEDGGTGRNKRDVWTITSKPYKGAHFATFSEELILPCILAGTSAKGACVKCGAPVKRIIKPSEQSAKYLGRDLLKKNEHPQSEIIEKGMSQKKDAPSINAEYETVGWEPTCKCGITETTQCIIMDPFMGAGTTGVAAVRNDRDMIGFELSQKYCDMANERISAVQNNLTIKEARAGQIGMFGPGKGEE